jgi:hypothetical protein
MKNLRTRHLGMLLLLPLLGGCQLFSAAGSVIGSLLSVALYLAVIAAPILLSYYLYHRHIL